MTPTKHAQLPAGWVWVTFGDLLSEPLANGLSIKGSETPPGVPALKLNAMGERGFNWSKVRYLPIDWDEVIDLEIQEGDFFISRGNGSLALVGRGTSAQKPAQRVIFPDTMIRARICEPIRSTGWVQTVWSCLGVREQIERRVKTTAGIWKISQGEIESIRLPIPPLSEQTRIVGEVEKQLTRLEAGVEALKRVQAQLKRYRASILKATCEGQLVPTEAELARREKRDYEPADKLLARILKERRARWEADQLARMKAAGKSPKDDTWKAKYVEPVFPAADLRAELPEGWSWTTVDSLLVEPPMNGLSVKESASPTEVRALRLSAMSNSGFDYSDYRFLPTHWSEVDDLEIREGDFFVSRGNGSLHLVGRGTVANNPPSRFIFPDTMIRLRLASPLSQSGWLSAIWSSLLVRRQIEASVKTTAGIFKISQPELARIVVPLPPFEEQIRAVHAIRAHLSIAEAGEDVVTASTLRAARLRQAVLKTAFEGSLVPQDPREEPASKLLERISAAMANKPLRKQGRAKQTTAVPKMKANR